MSSAAVQIYLESQIDELRSLIDVGLFSQYVHLPCGLLWASSDVACVFQGRG